MKKTAITRVGKGTLFMVLILSVLLAGCSKKTVPMNSDKAKYKRKYRCKCDKPKQLSSGDYFFDYNSGQPFLG